MTANNLSGLKKEIAESLAARAEFADIRITAEYPATREFPLKRPVIAVGLDSAELRGNLGGYIGVNGQDSLYGSECQITVRFDIYTPDGGTDPHAIMEKLCEALMLFRNAFGFSKLWSSAAAWDKTAVGLKLPVKGSLTATVGVENPGEGVSGVTIIANPH